MFFSPKKIPHIIGIFNIYVEFFFKESQTPEAFAVRKRKRYENRKALKIPSPV